MINHFRTHLLNKDDSFFEKSLFPVYTDVAFEPSTHTEFTRRVNNALFGENPDATLLDFRFFRFLRLIKSCDFMEHVRRFDSRETYELEQYDFTDESFYTTRISPSTGLRIQDLGNNDNYEQMRIIFTVRSKGTESETQLLGEKIMGAQYPDKDVDYSIPIELESYFRGVIHSLGIRIEIDENRLPGHWIIDYRRKDTCSVPVLINRALSLTEDTYASLFEFIREDAPEYEKGFRHITDQLHRFCMLLFAQAIAIEKLSVRG
jgi:hypothetical protein